MELVRGDTLSCGCLRSSFGELEIERILKENKVVYQKEFTFNDLRGQEGSLLRFDFAIFENEILSYLIEFDGEQHYSNKTDSFWKDSFEKRIIRDKIKNQYCINNNICLYRIPYWKKNELTFETLTDTKYLVK